MLYCEDDLNPQSAIRNLDNASQIETKIKLLLIFVGGENLFDRFYLDTTLYV